MVPVGWPMAHCPAKDRAPKARGSAHKVPSFPSPSDASGQHAVSEPPPSKPHHRRPFVLSGMSGRTMFSVTMRRYDGPVGDQRMCAGIDKAVLHLNVVETVFCRPRMATPLAPNGNDFEGRWSLVDRTSRALRRSAPSWKASSAKPRWRRNLLPRGRFRSVLPATSALYGPSGCALGLCPKDRPPVSSRNDKTKSPRRPTRRRGPF